MAEPIPAQKAPYGVNVEAGRTIGGAPAGAAPASPSATAHTNPLAWRHKNSAPSRLSKFGCAAVSPAPTSHSAMARIRAFE